LTFGMKFCIPYIFRIPPNPSPSTQSTTRQGRISFPMLWRALIRPRCGLGDGEAEALVLFFDVFGAVEFIEDVGLVFEVLLERGVLD